MTLHQKIKDQVKEAMIAKDTVRLTVIRGILSSCTNELVAQKRPPQEELSDEDVLAVIRRAVKQRKDSIDQFTKGGRPELAESEQAELLILETYLPQMMSKDEVITAVKAKIAEMGTVDKSKMGMIVGSIMKDLARKADGSMVKDAVAEVLS